MDIKLKNYNGKILKNRSLIFNCIFILTMFMITQVLGVMIFLKLINTTNINSFRNVKNDILSNGCDRSGSECHIVGDMSIANFLLYKVLIFN